MSTLPATSVSRLWAMPRRCSIVAGVDLVDRGPMVVGIAVQRLDEGEVAENRVACRLSCPESPRERSWRALTSLREQHTACPREAQCLTRFVPDLKMRVSMREGVVGLLVRYIPRKSLVSSSHLT